MTQTAADGDRSVVAQTFAELARVVHEQPGIDEVCRAIVDAATRLVPGCDHASIMLRERGRFRTAASSDDVAHRVDELEREVRAGPCVDAIESESYQLDADITQHSRWPELAARVLAETPVRGMAGYGLLVDGRKTGALNLFSDTAGALTAESADAGVVLASFASVSLGGSSSHEEARTLAEGMASNREIGMAIGLLMASHGLGAEEAFATLRKASSHLNRKISAIARELVANEGVHLPPSGD
ncbi:MAG TPA: GAF and ANTAR domain-containing protein [Angustibacter sp.]|nr:GAF and ANTAR domain-containing protein [Angustibacter sp.]